MPKLFKPVPVKKPKTLLRPYFISNGYRGEPVWLGFALTARRLRPEAADVLFDYEQIESYIETTVRRIWEDWPYRVLDPDTAAENKQHIIDELEECTFPLDPVTCRVCENIGEVNSDKLCRRCFEQKENNNEQS